MTENYEVIKEIIKNTLSEMYKEINEYIENIINSPSTINGIYKYYAIGLPSDPTVHERYIMFGGTIVRKYVIEDPEYDILLQSRLRELKKMTEKNLISDRNGYYKIVCPLCNSDLKESRQVAYPNGEVYYEFDCTECDFSGRIRKGNLYD